MGKVYLLLLTTLLASQVRGHCQFSFRDVSGSNGIFTYQDSEGNLQLQLSSVVKQDVTLTMHCGDGEIHSTTCKSNGKRNYFDPPMPLRCTTKPPEGTVELYNGDKTPYADCKETMYSIGHKIDGKFLTLYDVCYDTTALRARFSQARIYPKKINLPRPLDKLFSPSPVMSPFHANSFFKGEIYDRFKKIYGERQNYVANGAEVINRGHLTASSDFLFEDQLSSTYKLVNVVPQFASINSGNWNIIERWVQNLPVDDHGLIVRTGAFGVLKLKRGRVDKLAYLIEGAKNPVPAWLYKKITKTKADGSGTQSLVFLTYNNRYEIPSRSDHRFCTKINCPSGLTFSTAREAGYTVCCNAATFQDPTAVVL